VRSGAFSTHPRVVSYHRAALALFFAYYNFCQMHKTLRCTPAMAADVTKSVWSVKDLLLAVTDVM
jgi:hypothetical protein